MGFFQLLKERAQLVNKQNIYKGDVRPTSVSCMDAALALLTSENAPLALQAPSSSTEGSHSISSVALPEGESWCGTGLRHQQETRMPDGQRGEQSLSPPSLLAWETEFLLGGQSSFPSATVCTVLPTVALGMAAMSGVALHKASQSSQWTLTSASVWRLKPKDFWWGNIRTRMSMLFLYRNWRVDSTWSGSVVYPCMNLFIIQNIISQSLSFWCLIFHLFYFFHYLLLVFWHYFILSYCKQSMTRVYFLYTVYVQLKSSQLTGCGY